MTTTIPAWLQARQKTAKQRYEDTPTPKRGNETWRFGNFKQLNFENLSGEAAPADHAEIIARSTGLEAPLAKFVFLNDEVIFAEISLPEGVICQPLAEAFEKHSELVEAHFMQQETRLGSAKYAALHEASVTNGLFVHVPKGVEIDGTIEAHHWTSGEVTAFPHTLIVTGESSKVRVIDIFRSADDTTPSLSIAVNDLCAGKNSQLDYIAIQALNETSRLISVNETTTERDARAKGFILNTGAAWVRNESLTTLQGPNSHSDMLSVCIPDHEQEYDQRTFQNHSCEGAYSDLLYKNTLYGHSKIVFSGLIYVAEKAHQTDAYQTNRNLFMSDTSEANSMPGLEINANEVKCSHGSTSSQISDDEIFYLQARGIPADKARRLIARGYSVEAVQRLEDEPTETLLLKFIDEKFERIR